MTFVATLKQLTDDAINCRAASVGGGCA